MSELSKRINENTSITRESKKDNSSKIDNLSRQLNENNNELMSSLKELIKEVKLLQTKIDAESNKKASPKKGVGTKNPPKKKTVKKEEPKD